MKVQLFDASGGEDLIGHLVHKLAEQQDIVIQIEANYLLVNGQRASRILWLEEAP